MHADLVGLLALQAKDVVLADAEEAVAQVDREERQLDEGLRASRDRLDQSRQATASGAQARDALEAKIEGHRKQQDRRKLRLDQVHNAREASAVMAELDLAGSIMATEESEWVQAAETVAASEQHVREEEAKLAELESAVAPERAALHERRREAETLRDRARADREADAGTLNRALRTRYERLRAARTGPVVVPLRGGACGACNTLVPLSRRGQIRTGRIIDSCEGCGVILYPAEAEGHA